MFNWNTINKTYVYDGSFEGLLSIVFNCYISKNIPLKIIEKSNLEINFLDEFEDQITNYEHFDRIFNGIIKNISYDTLYNSYYAFLSNTKNKEINIVKYLLNGFVIGPKIILSTYYFYIHQFPISRINIKLSSPEIRSI